MKIEYENGKTEVRDNLIDPFYIAYVNGMILRPSCYVCPFAKQEGREADLTIGDYWGAENRIDDKEQLRKGIGLVLTNTGKGEQVWRELVNGGKVVSRELAFEQAVKRNAALVRPVKKKAKRGTFFEQMNAGTDFRRVVWNVFGKKVIKNRLKYLGILK